MKFLKYAVLSLLIITICKKITPESKSNVHKQQQKSLSSNIKKYDAEKKIATARDTVYVGIYEYNNQANNPLVPSKIIPAMIPFGTIHTKNKYNGTDKYYSKFQDIVTLYGTPVHGPRNPLRKVHTNQVIGFLWQEQDRIHGQDYGLGIAQMHTGETYAGVKAVHLPNYIQNHKNPHYTDDEKELLMRRYGIQQVDNPTLLGTAKLGSRRHASHYKRQNYMVYGVALPNLQQLNSQNHDMPLYKSRLTAMTYSIIAHHAIQKFLEKNNTHPSLNNKQQISSRDAASAIYSTLINH